MRVNQENIIQTSSQPYTIEYRLVNNFPNQSPTDACGYTSPYNSKCNSASINLETYIFFKNDASNHDEKNTGIDKTIYKIPRYLDVVTVH